MRYEKEMEETILWLELLGESGTLNPKKLSALMLEADELMALSSTRSDFNWSCYGFLEGIELESAPPRRFGPPAHDQRGRHKVVGELRAPRGLGTVQDFERLKRLASAELGTRNSELATILKASVPGPYTLSGRLVPNQQYQDRYALTEALLPIVRDELMRLVKVGCQEICVDEPSMSCYAHREDPKRLVDIFNRTVD